MVAESQEKEVCLHSAVLQLHSLQGSWRLKFQEGTDGDVDNNLKSHKEINMKMAKVVRTLILNPLGHPGNA